MKVIFLSMISFFLVVASSSGQEMDFQKLIEPAHSYSKYVDSGFHTWGAGMVKGEDNKYYLFYSRWPDSLSFGNWVTNSEIAIAVSNRPTGPYTFVKVALPKRDTLPKEDKKFWDADVTHNPTIHKFGDLYYLYYMGNYGNGEYWNHRNHQRIGVAVASSPLGPWKRFDKPLIDVSKKGADALMTSNPAICKGKNGKYVMVYKAVGNGPMPSGSKVFFKVAFSNSPTGPFVKQPGTIFRVDTDIKAKVTIEDPFIWFQNGKYWAIVKDMKGYFTHAGLSLALLESDNTIAWRPAKNVLVSRPEIRWVGDSVQHLRNLERAQLYILGGIPRVLVAAARTPDLTKFVITIPLSTLHEDLDDKSK